MPGARRSAPSGRWWRRCSAATRRPPPRCASAGCAGRSASVAGPDLAHRRLVAGETAALFAGTDAELDALGLALGASAPRERLEDAPAALREAELAAALRGQGRVVRWEPPRPAPAPRAAAARPCPSRSSRLLPHPELVTTLEAYLDRAGDAQAAAAALFIHRTTF